ncbi:MAG TPA: hypothetical protein VLL52_17320 [Anaerolineae bacterium]|nr:hypothetical protein [Anaerolineae bacterium]
MYTIAFIFLTLAHFYVFKKTLALHRQQPTPYTPILIILALALVYDNGLISLGRFLGPGPFLQNLSLPRFIMHALITPLLVIYTFGLARLFNLRWAQNRRNHAIACLTSVLFIIGNIWQDRHGFNLYPKVDHDLLRYTSDSTGPPIFTILTILVMIVIGFAILRQTKSPWVFFGSLFMFIAAAVGGREILPGNTGEAVLLLSLWLAERRLRQPDYLTTNDPTFFTPSSSPSPPPT